MSKFRKLVEDIVKPQPTYQYLLPEYQDALDKQVMEAEQWIDISELPGAYYDSNPYDVEPQLVGTSGGWFIDDEKVLGDAARTEVIKNLKADGAVEYLWDLIPEDKKEDDDFNTALTKEAIQYLESQLG